MDYDISYYGIGSAARKVESLSTSHNPKIRQFYGGDRMAVKDLNGRSFGSLKVIEFAGLSEKGKALWKCQCECGNVKTILGGDLTSGNTKTCGCSARKDLTGKKYRKLTVLEFSHVSKQQRFWKCRCDCGAIVHVTTRDLVSNNSP